jgi:predicted nucleic acid-binding protein
MIEVDSNVLVRFLVRDHAKQAARAEALIRANEIWVSKTVLCATTAEARGVLSRRHRRDFMD